MSTMGSIHGSKDGRFPKLAATMQERLKKAPKYSARRCIFRVPNPLRQTNEQAYTPLLVSIGPLHHKDKRLVPMEAHKLKYLQFFLEDAQVNAANLLSLCLGIVKDKETEIRECYADPIDLCSDDFTQMVLIDSAFIIQFFRKFEHMIQRDAGDYIYNEPFFAFTVIRDIQLVENQLPFFILDQLYRTAFQRSASDSESVPSFSKIACVFLGVDPNVYQPAHLLHQPAHLLDLLNFHSKPVGARIRTDANKNVDDKLSNSLVLPTATQPHEAGIKFQAIKVNKLRRRIWTLIEIEFDKENWILKIPDFCVSDITEYISRNLIAFEQISCGKGDICYITDFHYFLNCLINSPEDVELLVEAGIIEILMGSPKEVSNLINSLDTHAHFSPQGHYYKQISSDLIHHSKKRWPRYRATLVHTYFKHPWAAISVVYAILLLLLTIAQLVVGIMSIP